MLLWLIRNRENLSQCDRDTPCSVALFTVTRSCEGEIPPSPIRLRLSLCFRRWESYGEILLKRGKESCCWKESSSSNTNLINQRFKPISGFPVSASLLVFARLSLIHEDVKLGKQKAIKGKQIESMWARCCCLADRERARRSWALFALTKVHTVCLPIKVPSYPLKRKHYIMYN